MFNKFTYPFHISGTLAANANIRFCLPSNCSLVHVSAVASNDSDATIEVGTSADADGFITAAVIGDSNTPAEFELGDFDGALVTDSAAECPCLSDGDIVTVALDHDGDSGTAAADVTIVLTFTEG